MRLQMKCWCIAALVASMLSLSVYAAPYKGGSSPPKSACVLLIHGLAGSGWNWLGLRQLLQRHGYHVVIVRYPSRQQSIEVSAQALQPAIQTCLKSNHHPVHLVGHSMGGLLIRYYLQQYGSANIDRVVMLGTPNHGSELSDPAQQRPHERAAAGWLGPAVAQLSTAPNGFIAQLAEPSVPTGIIAGYLTPTPWLNRRFNSANDGLVAVYSTKLARMQDFTMLASIHSSLPLQVDAQRQTLWFLNTGRFYQPEPCAIADQC